VRVAENNGTGGAMMRISRPQPVSLDKGLCRMGIRSHTAENDTLPYPCDAEVCLGLQDSVEKTVEEYCDVAESKQITESESKSKCMI
jgi:hypothetical protein